MEETSNHSVVPEEIPAQLESAAPQVDPVQEADSNQSLQHDSVQSDQQDRSWVKKLRRDRDDAIRDSRMKDELIKQLLEAQRQPQAVHQAPEEDILQQIQREEYVPGEKVVKALKKQADDFERKLEELKKQSEMQKANSMLSELKREYSDFEEIVNPETLALLDETYPKLANTIAKNKDPYDAALLAYEAIKAKGLVDKVPQARREKEVEKRLEANKKTIQSPSSFEKRPMAQAFRMPQTKEEKAALYREMTSYASMAGGGY